MQQLIAIIPTRDRPESLKRALDSIENQSRHPDQTIVISSCSEQNYQLIKSVVDEYGSTINPHLIKNIRSPNLSGAINTAIYCLLSEDILPERTFLALLDDDDTWRQDYLSKCMNSAERQDLDWVICGIVRYEEIHRGKKLDIPKEIRISDFFIGNPNVQGSNLFIRMSKFLEAGGFDEEMVSTTDRDICIRLLQLSKIKFGFINKHLVNHYAFNNPTRLSFPGNKRKKEGLEYFYHKYSHLMSDDIENKFLERAKKLFHVDLRNVCVTPDVESRQPNPITNFEKTDIFIAISAHRLRSTEQLLDDIISISYDGLVIKKLIILDDCINGSVDLKSLVIQPKYKGLDIKLITRENIRKDLERNRFGLEKVKIDEKGVASVRHLLHYYAYHEAKDAECPIWIIDDDIRLKFRDDNGNFKKITPHQIWAEISRLKSQGVDFAIGPYTGDPPIPTMSIIRTQLIDLFYNLHAEKNIKNNGSYSVHRKPDYYYDYSDLHYSHLENPNWLIGEEKGQLINDFFGILDGKSVSRPLYWIENSSYNLSPNEPIIRGGNSLILNPECLISFPNLSPHIDNIRWKRGDSLWANLAFHVGGYTPGTLSLGVLHERSSDNGSAISSDHLLADFFGSSLIKAIHEFYNLDGCNSLEINEDEIRWILNAFHKKLHHRLIIFRQNSYRVRALTDMILKNNGHNPDLKNTLNTIHSVFSETRVLDIIERAKNISTDELSSFLKALPEVTVDYRGEID